MIDNLDIKGLLDEYGVSYRTRGKNVARGDLNLEVCPFCGNSSFHCCVNIYKPIFQCWVCGEKGFITKLLREMDVFEGKNIGQIIAPYVNDEALIQAEDINAKTMALCMEGAHSIILPKGILDDLPLPHRNYLIDRGFDPDFLIKQYKLKAVYNTGEQKYRFRIIAPVFTDGRMVSFVAAAVVRKEGVVKYLNCTPEEAVVPVNQCLYNYDSVVDNAVIVEGITDVWRMGAGFVATFRKGMTSEQILLLRQKNPKRVFIMYDPDAIKQSEKLRDQLISFFPYVEILELTNGDPGSQSTQEAMEIRKEIFS